MRILIWDLAAVAIIVICSVSAYQEGFLRSLVHFLGTAVSFAIGWLYSGPIARKSYELFLRQSVSEAVTDAVRQHGAQSFENVLVRVESFLEGLPSTIGDVVRSQLDADSLELWYQNMVRANSGDVAAALTEGLVEPVVTAASQIHVFCLLFLVCSIIASLAAGLLRGVHKLPIIGGIDSALGGVFGVVRGMLYVFVLAAALWLLIRLTGDRLPFIAQREIPDTKLFRFFFDAVKRLGHTG